MEGWKRLNERGHFVLPEKSKQAIIELEDMSSPSSAFLRDCCELVPDAVTPKNEVFQRNREWCELNNEKPTNIRQFSRSLIAASGRAIGTSKPSVGGRRVPCFTGIRLKPGEL